VDLTGNFSNVCHNLYLILANINGHTLTISAILKWRNWCSLHINVKKVETTHIHEVLSKSSQTCSKKKCWLNSHLLQNSLLGNIYSDPIVFSRFKTHSILAAISFKIVSLGIYIVILSFFPCFKNTVEVMFLNAVEYFLRLLLDVRHCFKTSSLQFRFQFG
jgi:hypothetical protein